MLPRLALIIATAAAPANWAGHYHLEYYAGRNAAGTGIVVNYDLTLTAQSCRLHAEGYQTDETILCNATPTPAGLDINFRSFGDGQVTNQYGVTRYKPGETLFSLDRTGGTLLTEWKAYGLIDDKPHPKGVYFKR